VRLTCKEAWRCIQHRPLTKLGVLRAAEDPRGYGYHVPLLRWCLRNRIVGAFRSVGHVYTIGLTGDAELVSEFLEIEPTTAKVMGNLLSGAAEAGHDELALQLWAELVKLPEYDRRTDVIMKSVAFGGCVRTAAVIDDDPAAWVDFVSHAMRNDQRPFVEWVLANVEPNENAQYVVEAAKSGSLELVKWLYTKGSAVRGEAMTYAVASGNVDLCKWLLDHGLVPDQRTMEAAVEWGHVQVLEWLSGMGCMCTTELLRHAVRRGGVPVVAWCLEHHSHAPDAGDLLVLSCENNRGTDVFEYLTDQRGFQSSPTELMRAAAENGSRLRMGGFDATVLVKRYGIPPYPGFIWEAIFLQDLARLRCALSQGQEVSEECYKLLIEIADATLLNEVLLARKVGDSIPEGDEALIERVLRDVDCQPNAKMVLADHSFFG
jgi:hypothetical protein